MDISENGIVLRVGKFRENDLWVHLLTASHGMLTAFAFGGSRSRRRFTGCLDSYNYIVARASSSKNGQFLNLQEASLLESYTRLRTEWARQGMAANCIRFVEAVGVSPEDGEKCFLLTKDMLTLLDTIDNAHPVLPLFFRFRMASEQGYAPNMRTCIKCGDTFKDGAYYLASEGYCVCKTCKPIGATGHYACQESLEILATIQEYSPVFWGNYTITSPIWREIGRIIDSLVQYHLGLEWAEGRFKKTFA